MRVVTPKRSACKSAVAYFIGLPASAAGIGVDLYSLRVDSFGVDFSVFAKAETHKACTGQTHIVASLSDA